MTRKVDTVVDALKVAGWRPVEGWMGVGVAFEDPADATDLPTPELIKESAWPGETYRRIRQVILLPGANTVFTRHSPAPWIGATVAEVSGAAAVRFIVEEART